MTTRWSIETVVVTTLPGCGLRLTTRLTRERRPASSPDASGWSSRMLTRGRKLALLPISSAVVLDTKISCLARRGSGAVYARRTAGGAMAAALTFSTAERARRRG